MLRIIISQYIEGLTDSLKGFLLIHKLDQPKGFQDRIPERTTQEISRQTVLKNRRHRDSSGGHLRDLGCELSPRTSTLKRIFTCAVGNLVPTLLLLTLTCLIDWLGPSLLSNFIGWLGSFALLPIFLLIRLSSTLWFADIAGAALKYRAVSIRKFPDPSRAASDFVHAIFAELIFLLQALLISSVPIPYISKAIGFICMAMLHSLYSFDYIWMANGISLNSRIALLERRWPYHLGFGTILTIATSISQNFIINGCIFGMLFPFFIVSSSLSEAALNSYLVNQAQIPPLRLHYLAQILTNKLSIIIFGRIC